MNNRRIIRNSRGAALLAAALAAQTLFAGSTVLTVAGYRGAAALEGFPLPVRISEEGVPGFTYAGAGGTVSFSSADGSRVYPCEVERWNPGGESLTWVRIPRLSQGETLRMAWGADAAKPCAEKVWEGYEGVWHFCEGGGRAKDSAGGRDAVPFGGHNTNQMVAAEGPSGVGRVLSGNGASFFRVEGSEQMKLGGRFTFSGWIKPDRINPFKLVKVATRTDDKWAWKGGGGWSVSLTGGEYVNAFGASNSCHAVGADFRDDEWHHIAVAYDGLEFRIYTDGERKSSFGRLVAPAGDVAMPTDFGFRAAAPANPITLRGLVDEFRIFRTPASDDWIKAEFDSLDDPSFVLAAGAKPRARKEAKSAPPPTLPVIPQVRKWTPAGGSTKLDAVVPRGSCDESKEVAALLAQDARDLLGGKASPAIGGSSAGTHVELAIDPSVSENAEGYRMVVGAGKVVITGASRTGLYWGTRTLLQLLDASDDKRTLPCGIVEDSPSSAVRGFVLDVGRKFFPLSYLADVAKVMSYYKMNDFHVHLNDNGMVCMYGNDWSKNYAAFRMECETYPGLAAKDGHYLKSEFRAFVKAAARRGVVVVPEIDAPAHAQAFTRYRPDFALKTYDPAHLDLKNPEVIPFFEKLYAEYLGGDDPVFAGPVVHVGTDEYWAKEAELFRAFADRMFEIVQSYGKTPRAWRSLDHCRGQTKVRAKGVQMDIWYNPYYSPYAALKAGYTVISVPDNDFYIVPAAGYYNDYLNLASIYRRWTPEYCAYAELKADDPGLLGGAFAVWNDHCGNGISADDVTDRAFPALQTMAEKLWRGRGNPLTYDEFAALADKTADAPGVNLRDRVRTDAADVVAEGEKAVGWSQKGGWTVTFDLAVDAAPSGEVALFDDGKSAVCLNVGGSGKFGFRRDGYNCPFAYAPPVGEKVSVKMSGDPKGTTLWINGALVERLEKPRRKIEGTKFSIAQMETLHFPLVRTRAAAGMVSNFQAKVGPWPFR